MKKFLPVLLVGFIGILISCNSKHDEGGMSERAKKNLAASHIVSDAIMSGDVSKIDDAVASDFVDHTERGDMGRDSLKAMVAMMKKEAPDMKMDIIKELADDDYVFSLMHYSGTSNGEMGMPPGSYDIHAIEVVKFNKDSKAIEHWEYMSNADMMKMMAGQKPGPVPDSTNKK